MLFGQNGSEGCGEKRWYSGRNLNSASRREKGKREKAQGASKFFQIKKLEIIKLPFIETVY